MQNPELPLPSLRSLGLLNTRGGEAVSQKLPPLRFIPGRVDATAVTDEGAWGGSLVTHTQTPQGEHPLLNQLLQRIDNPQRDAVPEAGTEPTATDNVLAQAGETHPQMAGGGEIGGQEVGGPMMAFHHVDFMKINGRTRKVEWVNLSA